MNNQLSDDAHKVRLIEFDWQRSVYCGSHYHPVHGVIQHCFSFFSSGPVTHVSRTATKAHKEKKQLSKNDPKCVVAVCFVIFWQNAM
ncbi:hypothetical protein NPIL_357361 [Nephila pilipes]|uniref:Uncharacterized protein n=1 Tax=Nephila pilipes TaxID=299642 RepID=A0A8X6QD51_NEPPI|nr:hypothetical protein NPIL_357361 [Nephila pilipes]